MKYKLNLHTIRTDTLKKANPNYLSKRLTDVEAIQFKRHKSNFAIV